MDRPNGIAVCRGFKCDQLPACEDAGRCRYVPSAEEARGRHGPCGFPPETVAITEVVRKFDTGATRSPETDKLDYDGFLSPLVLRRYAEYMHKNRVQLDGSVRASDNWQKGIPRTSYMKSMWRHFMGVWSGHRSDVNTGHVQSAVSEEELCALFFNVHGYLHELLKAKAERACVST